MYTTTTTTNMLHVPRGPPTRHARTPGFCHCQTEQSSGPYPNFCERRISCSSSGVRFTAEAVYRNSLKFAGF